MDDDITEVQQDPVARLLALDAQRRIAGLLGLERDIVGQRLHIVEAVDGEHHVFQRGRGCGGEVALLFGRKGEKVVAVNQGLVEAGAAYARSDYANAFQLVELAPETKQVTIHFWTNLLIRAYCWILLLRDTGIINNYLIKWGIIDEPLTLLYTNFAIFLGLVYTHIPFMVLPIYARVEKLDFNLLEAAHDLYASRRQLMRHVILPLAAPGIIAGSLLVFVPCLGDFIIPNLLGGGKHLMIGSLIQLQFGGSRNWPFGSAAALILMSFVLIAMMIYVWGPGRKMKPEGDA